MQNAARTDKGCLPNVITYSALITAFVAGGRLARAHEIFLSMRHSNIAPDHICYSTLIAGGAASLYPLLPKFCRIAQKCHETNQDCMITSRKLCRILKRACRLTT